MLTNFQINSPLSKKDVKKLKAGDIIDLSGKIITARDLAHERIINYIKSNKKIKLFTFHPVPSSVEGSVR